MTADFLRRDRRFSRIFCLLRPSAAGLVVLTSLSVSGLSQSSDPAEAKVDTPPAQNQNDDARDLDDDDVDFLTRGPLHEGFAEPYDADPAPAPIVEKEPPETIDEVPPEYQPEGKDVEWIPGYWQWDEERDDFVWVSGVWRDVPPGRRWVPGYWESAGEEGYRRISGFWANNDVDEVQYLPEPPQTLDVGPSSPAPSDDHFYVPGCWVYQTNNYQWRPGFWSTGYDNWVWVPEEYIWTSRGCIHRPGYWDYGLDRRGVLFTPVYYHRPIYLRPNYLYRPWYTVRSSGLDLLAFLFVRPRWGGYYFGDFYGPRFRNSYYPWVNYRQYGFGYDPLLTHYRFRGRRGGNRPLDVIGDRYRFYENNPRYRPPHTVRSQRNILESNRDLPNRGNAARWVDVSSPLDEVARRGNSSGRDFRRLGEDDIRRIRESNRPLASLADQRRRYETSGRSGIGLGDGQGRSARARIETGSGSEAGLRSRGSLQLPPVASRGRPGQGGDRETRMRARLDSNSIGRDQRGQGVGVRSNNSGRSPRSAIQDGVPNRRSSSPSISRGPTQLRDRDASSARSFPRGSDSGIGSRAGIDRGNSPRTIGPSSRGNGIDIPGARSSIDRSPSIRSRGSSSPSIVSPSIRSPRGGSPSISSPGRRSPGIGTPNIGSPNVRSPMRSPSIRSPSIRSPSIGSPAISPRGRSGGIRSGPPARSGISRGGGGNPSMGARGGPPSSRGSMRSRGGGNPGRGGGGGGNPGRGRGGGRGR